MDETVSVVTRTPWRAMLTDISVAWDTIAEITFGAPLGFLDQGRDAYNLIKSNQKATRYFALVCLPDPGTFTSY
jgi:hypothetical protein